MNREVLFTNLRPALIDSEVFFTNQRPALMNREVFFTNQRQTLMNKEVFFTNKRLTKANAEVLFTKNRALGRHRVVSCEVLRVALLYSRMDTLPPSAPNAGTQLPEDSVFLALCNAGRRHLLRRLVVAGGSMTASEAASGDRKHRNLTVKNLTFLASLHVLLPSVDSADARKQRYTLTPYATPRRTEAGWELDFGCAVLRWAAGSEARPYPRPLVRNRR